MTPPSLGALVQSFFLEGLVAMKGLRPASVQSYRDTIPLFLRFLARDTGRRVTRMALAELTFDRALRFVGTLEAERHNHVRTRNQRLACLNTFFEYLAGRVPEMLAVAERVAAIPMKRTAPPETRFLERDELQALSASLKAARPQALRDRALLLFLHDTGARVQEMADLRVSDLDLGPSPRVRLHGNGDKWRTCPLWAETARLLRNLLEQQAVAQRPDAPVFASSTARPLTRFGIYKLVRRHTQQLEAATRPGRHISPHVFRHTTAVHLLEAGVEINVIRGWLGHVSLDTAHRYAELNLRTKEAALRLCEPPTTSSAAFPPHARLAH